MINEFEPHNYTTTGGRQQYPFNAGQIYFKRVNIIFIEVGKSICWNSFMKFTVDIVGR